MSEAMKTKKTTNEKGTVNKFLGAAVFGAYLLVSPACGEDATNPCYRITTEKGRECKSNDPKVVCKEVVKTVSTDSGTINEAGVASEAGTKEAGVSKDAGVSTVAGSVKTDAGVLTDSGAGKTDASVTLPETVCEQVANPGDAGPEVGDLSVDAGDLSVDASDSGVSATCPPEKVALAYAKLGRNYKNAGVECKDNDETALVDGQSVEHDNGGVSESCKVSLEKTEDTDEKGMKKITGVKLVSLTCKSGTFKADDKGCTKTTTKVTSCEESDKVQLTGWTTANKGYKSRAILEVSYDGDTENVYVTDDGKDVSTRNFNSDGTPVKGVFRLLIAGDDGVAVVAGRSDGPSGKSTCGKKVGATSTNLGDVSVKNLASQNDVAPDSKFYATFEVDGEQFPQVDENGPALDVKGEPVKYTGSVVGKNGKGVKLEESEGQKRSCTLTKGSNTSEACDQAYNEGEVKVLDVQHVNGCTTISPDAGVVSDASVKADAGVKKDSSMWFKFDTK